MNKNRTSRPKAVKKPFAPYATLYPLRSIPDNNSGGQLDEVPLPNTLPSRDVAVIRLLEAAGCRISEVLNIAPYDVLPNGSIVLKGLKGGQNRVISKGVYSQWFLANRLFLPLKSTSFNRFYYYRLLLKLGLYTTIGTRSKRSVTHYFRHKIISELRQGGLQSEEIAQFTGHRKASNTDLYGR